MKLIPNTMSRGFGRNVLRLKKNSPHIFFAGGIVGVVGATVMACRATLKLEPALDEFREDVENVKGLAESKLREKNGYEESDYYRDLGTVYGKAALKLGTLYGPSIVVGGISIAALAGSHIQLTRRNAALSATLTAVTKAYDEYRSRVRELVGEETERDIFLNTEEVTVDKEIVRAVKDPASYSMYAKIFDEANPEWKKDPEHNRIFIQCQQNYANHLLQSRGHVFLNDVYDSLSIPRTRAGAVVGWVLGGDGDNYIDFGIFEAYNADFVNGYERSIILDFNVDGVVYDLI